MDTSWCNLGGCRKSQLRSLSGSIYMSEGKWNLCCLIFSHFPEPNKPSCKPSSLSELRFPHVPPGVLWLSSSPQELLINKFKERALHFSATARHSLSFPDTLSLISHLALVQLTFRLKAPSLSLLNFVLWISSCFTHLSKKIFNSKPVCTASKCDIVQKCDTSFPQTLRKAVNNRKIRAYRLLIKLFLENVLSKRPCSLLIYYESYLLSESYQKLPKVKNICSLWTEWLLPSLSSRSL